MGAPIWCFFTPNLAHAKEPLSFQKRKIQVSVVKSWSKILAMMLVSPFHILKQGVVVLYTITCFSVEILYHGPPYPLFSHAPFRSPISSQTNREWLEKYFHPHPLIGHLPPQRPWVPERRRKARELTRTGFCAVLMESQLNVRLRVRLPNCYLRNNQRWVHKCCLLVHKSQICKLLDSFVNLQTSNRKSANL
jgi:hypothetical protein